MICPGGYYTIEQKDHKLRIIALNTNLYSGSHKGDDPSDQFSWLQEVLDKSHRLKEKVLLLFKCNAVETFLGIQLDPYSFYPNKSFL